MPPDEEDKHDCEAREHEDAEPDVAVLGEVGGQGEGGQVQGEGADFKEDLGHGRLNRACELRMPTKD